MIYIYNYIFNNILYNYYNNIFHILLKWNEVNTIYEIIKLSQNNINTIIIFNGTFFVIAENKYQGLIGQNNIAFYVEHNDDDIFEFGQENTKKRYQYSCITYT